MARYIGDATLDITYDVSYWGPLDTRMLVPLKSDLITESTWIQKGKTDSSAYNGMIVAVAGDPTTGNDGIFYLKDYTNVTSEDSWIKLVELNELNDLADRVAQLESNKSDTTGITEDQLNAAVDSLRQEIISSGYLTEDQLTSYGYITSDDLTGYATKDDVSSAVGGLASFAYVDEKVLGLASESFVAEKIAEAQLSGSEVDLTPYAKTAEVDSKLSGKADQAEVDTIFAKVDEHSTNISSLLSDVSNLNTTVENKADKTDIPDVSGLATKASVTQVEADVAGIEERVSTVEDTLQNKADTSAIPDVSEFIKVDVDNLTNYYSKTEIDSKLGGYATNEDITTAIEDLASKEYVAEVTTDFVKFADLASATESLASKDYVDESITSATQNLASKDYVTDAINNAQLSGDGSSIDLSIYATKEEVAAKANQTYVETEIASINESVANLTECITYGSF